MQPWRQERKALHLGCGTSTLGIEVARWVTPESSATPKDHKVTKGRTSVLGIIYHLLIIWDARQPLCLAAELQVVNVDFSSTAIEACRFDDRKQGIQAQKSRHTSICGYLMLVLDTAILESRGVMEHGIGMQWIDVLTVC